MEAKKDHRDAVQLDCDQNRTALRKLFASTFKDASVSEIENHFSKAAAELRGVMVYFHDLAEVHALPLPFWD